MSVETQLNASEKNVASKGGIGGKEDRRGLPKRHQSFARTFTWCPAVCVTESNGRSLSPSPGTLQYVSRKVTVLRPHPHQRPCSVCWGKCLSFARTLTWCPAVYVAESVCPSPWHPATT